VICGLNAGFTVKFMEVAGELDLELLAEASAFNSRDLLVETLGLGSQAGIADANLTSNMFAVFQKL
jgi:hypothetical protein